MSLSTSQKKLVLFDIDGTILSGGKIWKETFFKSAEKILNRELGEPPVSFGGKTDPQICHEILDYLDHPKEEYGSFTQKLLAEYLDEVEKIIQHNVSIELTLHPGVKELISELKQKDGVQLALLTGNIERGAYLKLSLVQLENEFKWGAFGSDHANRYELPRIAQKKALDRFGIHYEGQEIVIIGDTPHDVNCGKSIGVRSIAVATGKTPLEELLKHEPHYSFRNLAETNVVLNAILNN